MEEQFEKKRICLYGGPCSGKSTTAHYLMWRLKSAGHQAVFVEEAIKNRAFRGDQVLAIEQPCITGEQMRREIDAISTGAVVVTESPVLLGEVYNNAPHGFGFWRSQARNMDKVCPAIHVFINRQSKKYDEAGRYESQEEAIWRDNDIKNHLRLAFNDSWIEVNYPDIPEHFDKIWQLIFLRML